MSEKLLKAAVLTLAFLLLLLIFALGRLLTDDASSAERHQASLGPIAFTSIDGSTRITSTVICSSADA